MHRINQQCLLVTVSFQAGKGLKSSFVLVCGGKTDIQPFWMAKVHLIYEQMHGKTIIESLCI